MGLFDKLFRKGYESTTETPKRADEFGSADVQTTSEAKPQSGSKDTIDITSATKLQHGHALM